MMTSKPNTIDEYIAAFPTDVQTVLQQVRATIRKAAPDAQETIKYAMPTYVLDGNLVYFAAFQYHIGFYATPTGNEAFTEDLSGYKTGKGSIQFPLSQPMPLDLITRIVRFRVAENQKRARLKTKTKA
ncbi:hypothetical protein DYU11_01475 [Fibrisoma montanum]|uniref:YdhG-like domain-containing protein n=1 Tax=Fibrisoma montanum TaxID=2305895 RepID=A0A418MHW8_9BACT|nr:DUF1801 domain-containing protein [Fibrisoma montanum]RIV27016.1 hypothetical protein DYU11_01475 [Fibrisoma montanum]